ncbi:hypothetical protein PsYK624_042910 [Phanerochaete sordida]|uniref:Secreted protein n=1 Tax=Phanerochaete sordida TaxID=48140 RepID=A0A9P3G4M7_9APHY|nr:hypothetical protein PsYK624_042910 [Phanerochaete sordida]
MPLHLLVVCGFMLLSSASRPKGPEYLMLQVNVLCSLQGDGRAAEVQGRTRSLKHHNVTMGVHLQTSQPTARRHIGRTASK